MEPEKNEQGPISISQRLRLIKDRLIPRETPPVQWEEWKQAIIRSGPDGIPEESAPQRFIVSKSFLDTFQEMLPIRYPGRIENRKPSEAAEKARKGLEVARSLIVDASGRLMVNTKDVGESELTANGVRVKHGKAGGEVGIAYTPQRYNAFFYRFIPSFIA